MHHSFQESVAFSGRYTRMLRLHLRRTGFHNPQIMHLDISVSHVKEPLRRHLQRSYAGVAE